MRFEFYNSKISNALIALCLLVPYCAMVAVLIASLTRNGISALLGSKESGVALGVLAGAYLSGAGAYSFAKRVFDRRPQIVIDDEGIYSRDWFYGVVPWAEIAKAEFASWGGWGSSHSILKLTLLSPDTWFSQSPWFNRVIKELTGSDVAYVQFSTRTPYPHAASSFIQDHLRARQGSQRTRK